MPATKGKDDTALASDPAANRVLLASSMKKHLLSTTRFGADREWLKDAATESAAKMAQLFVDARTDDEVRLLCNFCGTMGINPEKAE
jgi:hypothetical protein